MNKKQRKQALGKINKEALLQTEKSPSMPSAQQIVDSSLLTEESKAFAHDVFQKLLVDLRSKLVTE